MWLPPIKVLCAAWIMTALATCTSHPAPVQQPATPPGLPGAGTADVSQAPTGNVAHLAAVRLAGHRPGAAANRSIAASASMRSPLAPRSSSVSTRTPVAGTQYPSCPDRNRSSICAHLGYGTVAVAAPGPLPRAPHVEDRKHEQVEPPAQAHVADLPQHRQSALTLGRGLPMHQCHAQRPPGRAQREILAQPLSDRQRLVDVAERGVVGQQHSIRYRTTVP
jgi:hypothetical protein